MRLIGHLKNEANAKTFAGYLAGLDIRNLVEPDTEGWAVWIYSEDQIDAGHQALNAYLQNPGDLKFQRAAENAALLEERSRREAKAFARRVRTSDQIWSSSGRTPVTMSLIVICVAVTLLYWANPAIEQWLLLSLPEVEAGQIWRLITPLFIHFSLTHIAFNMFVLYDLGMLIERRQGSLKLGILTVVIGIGSNLAQYHFGGPFFGGISGVLYGLLGYIWVRGRCDPGSGLMLSPLTLAIMLGWFFLCLFGIIPAVANWAHGAGLLMGMLWGALPLAKKAV